MVKRFFAEMFLTFGIIILLINLLMAFNQTPFNNSQYFGITTLIDMFDPNNASNQEMTTNIVSYMQWVKKVIPEFANDVKKLRDLLSARNKIPFTTDGIQWFDAIYNLVVMMTYVVQVIVVIGLYLILMLMYIVYLLDAFLMLITGNWVSVKPTAYWTYPQVVYGLTPVFTI